MSKSEKEVWVEAGDYKVCEGCEAIVHKNHNVCPECLGYRWDERESRVVAEAERAGVGVQKKAVAA